MRSDDTPGGLHRRTTIRRSWQLGAAALTAVALAAGCTDNSAWVDPRPTTSLVAANEVSALRVVDGCETLVSESRVALASAVSSMWPNRSPVTTTMSSMPSNRSADDGTASADSSGSAEAETFSAAPVEAVSGVDAANDAAAGDGSSAAGGEPTGTNNQEAGVDESDLVKTDGSRIVSIVSGVLRVTVLDDSPAIDGTLDLSMRSATDLFLRGDTALVLGTTYGGDGTLRGSAAGGDVTMDSSSSDIAVPPTSTPVTTMPSTQTPDTTVPLTSAPRPAPTTTVVEPGPDEPAPSTTLAPTPTVTMPTDPIPVEPIAPSPFLQGTTLTLVSLEDPAAPRIIQTAEVEGSLVSARQIGDTARIVLRSEPQAMYDMMRATDATTASAVVEDLDSEQLLPRVAVDGTVEPLGGCSDILLTAAPTSGVGTSTDAGTSSLAGDGSMDTSFPAPTPSTVTVLTVDETLDDLRPVSVQGAADTIYASTDALYVAAGSWDQAGSRTDVHRFDLPAEGPAVYSGSGRVPGRLLNQFSLSDHEDALRVVTTVDAQMAPVSSGGAPIPDGAVAAIEPIPQTSARLTVLDTGDDTLDEIGHLDGLGIGEEVQSVRFMGDTGYVVTFRQTDPLYALDLSDPRAPRSLGELKIPGFSEYLHPVGDGLLLGIGRDADPTNGRDLGFKVSLFDVSDPAAMVEVDQLIVPNAWSAVSSDHKAFTWDAERSQAVFPVSQGCGMGDCESSESAVVLRVGDGTLDEVARISHDTGFGSAAPMRSIVLGDDLWTLSYGALGRSDAANPTSVDLVRF